MALTFQLPLADRSLSPNARPHWAVKAKAKKLARALASKEAGRVLCEARMEPPRWCKAGMKAVFFLLPKQQQPDPDNIMAMLKPYIDGLADAGIVANDKNLWPERPEVRRVERLPRVEITITEETK